MSQKFEVLDVKSISWPKIESQLNGQLIIIEVEIIQVKLNFQVKFNFRQKSKQIWEKSNSIEFRYKMQILTNNRNSGQKSNLFVHNSIFGKNSKFWTKILFSV